MFKLCCQDDVWSMEYSRVHVTLAYFIHVCENRQRLACRFVNKEGEDRKAVCKIPRLKCPRGDLDIIEAGNSGPICESITSIPAGDADYWILSA